jgi:hypothetical protein
MSGRVITKFATLVALFSFVFAGAAFAADTPTQTVYGNPAGDVLGNVNTGGENDVIPPPSGGGAPETDDEDNVPTAAPNRERGGDTVPAAPSAGGDLPFTGFEAALVAMAGLALLGTGLAVRRATRTAPTA